MGFVHDRRVRPLGVISRLSSFCTLLRRTRKKIGHRCGSPPFGAHWMRVASGGTAPNRNVRRRDDRCDNHNERRRGALRERAHDRPGRIRAIATHAGRLLVLALVAAFFVYVVERAGNNKRTYGGPGPDGSGSHLDSTIRGPGTLGSPYPDGVFPDDSDHPDDPDNDPDGPLPDREDPVVRWRRALRRVARSFSRLGVSLSRWACCVLE